MPHVAPPAPRPSLRCEMSSRKRGRRPAAPAVTEIPVQNLVNDKFTLVRIDAPPHVEIREGVRFELSSSSWQRVPTPSTLSPVLAP